MRHFANYSEALWRMTVPTRTFLISLTSFYVLIAGVEDHCRTLSHSVTYTHTHTHTYSVGLLWTSYQPVAGMSTRLHTTFTRDIHAAGGIRTRNSSKWKAADPRLRPGDHRDPPSSCCNSIFRRRSIRRIYGTHNYVSRVLYFLIPICVPHFRSTIYLIILQAVKSNNRKKIGYHPPTLQTKWWRCSIAASYLTGH